MARLILLANAFFFACLIVFIVLPMTARHFGLPVGVPAARVERLVSAVGIWVVFSLVVTGLLSVVAFIIAVGCDNRRSMFYCVYSFLISVIAGVILLFMLGTS